MNETQETPAEETPEPSAPETPSAPSDSGSSLERQIDAVQSHVSALGKKANKGATTMGVVGVVLLGLLLTYFLYGKSEISQLIEPEFLVPLIEEQVKQKALPQLSSAAEKFVDDNAEDLIGKLNQQAIAFVPELRERIETYADEKSDEMLEKSTQITKEKFTKILRENKPALKKVFLELSTSEELSQASLDGLVKLIEAEVQADLKDDAQIILRGLKMLSTKLQKLHNKSGLNPEEGLEREMILNLRGLMKGLEGSPLQL